MQNTTYLYGSTAFSTEVLARSKIMWKMEQKLVSHHMMKHMHTSEHCLGLPNKSVCLSKPETVVFQIEEAKELS